jgi:hypothetical protein
VPWANFDDQFPKHPKVLPLSDAAFRLHVSGVCHAAQYLTDGVLRAEVVPILVPRFKKSTLDELLRRGQWHDLGDGCGTDLCPLGLPESYVIHDYLQWNRGREQIEEERERIRSARSAAGKKGAAARWQKR